MTCFECMLVESESLTKRFLIFILNITYKYHTSSDNHPQRLFNLESSRGGVVRGYCLKEELFKKRRVIHLKFESK